MCRRVKSLEEADDTSGDMANRLAVVGGLLRRRKRRELVMSLQGEGMKGLDFPCDC